jgi:type I restriction enzyme S subunit
MMKKYGFPDNWGISDIETCIHILDNKRKPVSAKERAKRLGEIPYYGATGIAGYIDDYIFNEELVLLGEDGAPFLDRGKDVAYLIKGKSWVNNHAHVLKAKNNITTNKFVLYFLNQFNYEGFVGGTTRLKLNQGNLRKIPIVLPPRPEQDRIVAKVDTLLAQVETMQKSLDNLKSIKSRFLYSCLIDSNNNSFFKRVKIGQFLTEGTERVGELWPKYRLIGVSAKEGITDLRVGQKKTFANYKIVKKGDFIYNTMRVNIGSIAIYKDDTPAITSPDYVVFRTNENLSSDLLLGFLKSDQGLLEIGANTKGSVRARLYFKSLSEIRMPYADRKIHKIAQEFLSSFNLSLDKLQNIYDQKFPKLKQAILNKAFRGELVEQVDSDGDAKELLKEIEGMKKVK